MDTDSIFNIKTNAQFESKVFEIFNFQYKNNTVYREFCNHFKKTPSNINGVHDIPFLPIDFYKSKKVVSTTEIPQTIFTSSGTTGSIVSKHYVENIELYEKSYIKGFETFYGPIKDFCVLALLPSYLERKGSSLIYMANDFIAQSKHKESGFYLNDLSDLKETLETLKKGNIKTLLIGVSFALLDFVEEYNLDLKNVIIMETGGMKGRRKEMIREELHYTLKKGFGVVNIHSEYGMTELLSQAYSKGNGIFNTPPWMKVLVRDPEDPLSYHSTGKTGGINVIDLANIYSCSFIATQDLGKIHQDDSFEILGRFDHSDIRGCNLMVL